MSLPVNTKCCICDTETTTENKTDRYWGYDKYLQPESVEIHFTRGNRSGIRFYLCPNCAPVKIDQICEGIKEKTVNRIQKAGRKT